jgi:transcriptional regulator with XRE-family HTH domain
LGLSQTRLAASVGVSPQTIKAYEAGFRHPSRRVLGIILDSLRVAAGRRNEILLGAGFAPERAPLSADTPGYSFTISEAAAHIEEYPWPSLVVNEAMEVVAANATMQRLWGIDLERDFRPGIGRNMLAVGSDPRFADRVQNWEEVLGVAVSVFKGHHRGAETLPEGNTAYFAEVMNRFAAGSPEYVSRFLSVWQAAEPREPKVRWWFPVVWADPGLPKMSFAVVATACNETEALSFNDWIPVDSETWRGLAMLPER